MFPFVCNDCKDKNHNLCVDRNRDKVPADCDCQHRLDGRKR